MKATVQFKTSEVFGKKTKTYTKDFNGESHLRNYIRAVERKRGWYLDEVWYLDKGNNDDLDPAASYIEDQLYAPYDNFANYKL